MGAVIASVITDAKYDFATRWLVRYAQMIGPFVAATNVPSGSQVSRQARRGHILICKATTQYPANG
ncbi:hypothetical protein [Paracoccus sp. (in: a-proteobacteria)]|uniref:hypothetical protein n=1 Tax=Paracoccus sp. TaxID=267 RepID=UPI0028A1026F|nr:hypothetical protein [Paracoccus sp. (in: a-proteobacteria)]